MKTVNFAYQTGSYDTTPPELIGCSPLGGGGVMEALYRHFFEVRHFQRLVGSLDKSMNVLELGSGNGRWVETLAPRVGHYTAVDLTPEAVAIAQEMAARKNITNVDFHTMSITDFRGNRPYDVIYFSGVSQFLDDGALGKVLDDLALWIKPSTVIVDRSSLNFEARSITDTDTYFSIYRTPGELDAVFAARGLKKTYRASSYRYLRGMEYFDHRPNKYRALLKLVAATRPISFHVMNFVIWLADTFNPVDLIKRGWSHDFSVYRKAGR